MKLIAFFVLLGLVFLGLRLAITWASSTPATAGIVEGALGPCPSTPNCVNSTDSDSVHAIDALPSGNDTTLDVIAVLLESQPGTTIVTRKSHYLHAIIRSRAWGFVDDLELLQPAGRKTIEVRSASRLGVSDLGANRKRVEFIRQQLQNLQP